MNYEPEDKVQKWFCIITHYLNYFTLGHVLATELSYPTHSSKSVPYPQTIEMLRS